MSSMSAMEGEDSKPVVKPPRREWPTPQKSRVKALYHEAGWSKRAIAKELGMPRTTVRDLLESNKPRRD
ncbi:MAG: hypothetical protein M1823_007086, partial [Watsoniomyces obsoletus]